MLRMESNPQDTSLCMCKYSKVQNTSGSKYFGNDNFNLINNWEGFPMRIDNIYIYKTEYWTQGLALARQPQGFPYNF
jgi:hypothetical protein